LIYVSCICYTIAFLFSPPIYENEFDKLNPEQVTAASESDDDIRQHNIYLQANHGLVGHVYEYGNNPFMYSLLTTKYL
jgi:hypothetical protein